MSNDTQYIAFYGTLMQEQHTDIRMQLGDKLKYVSNCQIPGNIYDLGRYPGLKINGNRRSVRGELYEINDQMPLSLLDEYESHDNYDKSLPGFTRRLVELNSPQQLAWVYEYDGPVEEYKLIENEEWT